MPATGCGLEKLVSNGCFFRFSGPLYVNFQKFKRAVAYRNDLFFVAVLCA